MQSELPKLLNSKIAQTFEMYGNFARHLGYPPLESNRTNGHADVFNNKKVDRDLEWWQIPIVIVVSPIVIVCGFIFGKNWAIEQMEKYIDDCKIDFQKIINNQVKEVTRMLESVKSKVIKNG